jgi:hypothetical protein
VKINSLVRSPSGVVTLDFTKTTDAAVVLEWTRDFVTWTELATNALPAGTYDVEDATAVNFAARYYRLRVE